MAVYSRKSGCFGKSKQWRAGVGGEPELTPSFNECRDLFSFSLINAFVTI
jgi:hypothetical protein